MRGVGNRSSLPKKKKKVMEVSKKYILINSSSDRNNIFYKSAKVGDLLLWRHLSSIYLFAPRAVCTTPCNIPRRPTPCLPISFSFHLSFDYWLFNFLFNFFVILNLWSVTPHRPPLFPVHSNSINHYNATHMLNHPLILWWGDTLKNKNKP